MRVLVLVSCVVLFAAHCQAWNYPGQNEYKSSKSVSKSSSVSSSKDVSSQTYVDDGNGYHAVGGTHHHDEHNQQDAMNHAEKHGYKSGWGPNGKKVNRYDQNSDSESHAKSDSSSDESFSGERYQVDGQDYKTIGKQGGWQNNKIQGGMGNAQPDSKDQLQNAQWLGRRLKSQTSQQTHQRRTSYDARARQRDLRRARNNGIRVRQVKDAIAGVKQQLKNVENCRNTGEEMATKIQELLENAAPNVPWFVDSPRTQWGGYQRPGFMRRQPYEWIWTSDNVCRQMDRGEEYRFFAVYPIVSQRWKLETNEQEEARWTKSNAQKQQADSSYHMPEYGSGNDDGNDY